MQHFSFSSLAVASSRPQFLANLPRRMTSPPANAASNNGTNGASSSAGQAEAPATVDIKRAADKFKWDIAPLLGQRPDFADDPRVKAIPLNAIRRPLQRANNQEKVEVLKTSIAEVGLREPIDILEVDGQYWGFSGCHRFQAHQELGLPTIWCKVRKATPQVLRYHMM